MIQITTEALRLEAVSFKTGGILREQRPHGDLIMPLSRRLGSTHAFPAGPIRLWNSASVLSGSKPPTFAPCSWRS